MVKFGIANYESVVPVIAVGIDELGFRQQVPRLDSTFVSSYKPRLLFQLPIRGAVAPAQPVTLEILEPGDRARDFSAFKRSGNDGNVARSGYVRQIESGDKFAIDEKSAAFFDGYDPQVVPAPGAGVEGFEGSTAHPLGVGV